MASNTNPEQRVETMARTIARALVKLDKTDRAAARALTRAAELVAADIRAGKL